MLRRRLGTALHSTVVWPLRAYHASPAASIFHALALVPLRLYRASVCLQKQVTVSPQRAFIDACIVTLSLLLPQARIRVAGPARLDWLAAASGSPALRALVGGRGAEAPLADGQARLMSRTPVYFSLLT